MLWRMVAGALRTRPPLLGPWRVPARPGAPAPALQPARRSGYYIPPTQYDTPLSPKFKPGYVLRVHWEIIPLFVTTAISIFILFVAIIWACKNKVDVVFSTHSCNNISRTMNLRRPTVHKMMIVFQRYEPWPEMQDVIDKLAVAERRAMLKATQCSYEQRTGHEEPIYG